MRALGMAESSFTLKYDGDALRNHQMPVRELAPALLALGDLFVEASAVLYPKRDPVGLNIQGAGDGSFLIDLVLRSPQMWDQFVDLLGGHAINALANLENLVVGSRGVLGYIKKRKHREIAMTQPAAEPGIVAVRFTDGTEIEVQ